MRRHVILTLPAILAASGAAAHPGHVAEVAGHGHWVAAGAIGLAVAIGLWAKLRDRKSGAEDSEAEAEAEAAEPEEA